MGPPDPLYGRRLYHPRHNRAENTIRPFVLGRKNWLFSDTPKGAQASAAFYSLIETAKANGIEPNSYLKYIFTKLPHAKSTDDLKHLLPQYLDRDDMGRGLAGGVYYRLLLPALCMDDTGATNSCTGIHGT